MPELIIRRVLSNNAVLAAESCSEAGERILVGKGIGFSKKPGDYVEHGGGSREYVEISEQHRALLEGLSSIDGATFQVISASIDIAADVLGTLHPSVYVILAEHLSFAVQRVGRGETIRNSLVAEIKAVVPEEFSAAELVVNYLNTHLDSIVLPIDEAAFIALHLHAARTGGTVKQPLAVANRIGRVTAKARKLLDAPTEAGGMTHYPWSWPWLIDASSVSSCAITCCWRASKSFYRVSIRSRRLCLLTYLTSRSSRRPCAGRLRSSRCFCTVGRKKTTKYLSI